MVQVHNKCCWQSTNVPHMVLRGIFDSVHGILPIVMLENTSSIPYLLRSLLARHGSLELGGGSSEVGYNTTGGDSHIVEERSDLLVVGNSELSIRLMISSDAGWLSGENL
eukprot:gene12511-biopygen3410